MTDPWLLVEPGRLAAGTTIRLDAEESRHVAGALRLREGSGVFLTDGQGRLAEGTLLRVSTRSTDVEVRDVRVVPASEGPCVTLALAVLSSQAMDWAVQKSVEVGVESLVPLLTTRTQLGDRAVRVRIDRWRRIARQALKQCRRPRSMEIGLPQTLAETAARPERGIVADRHGTAFSDLAAGCAPFLVVGPEGGFTDDELHQLDPQLWPRLRLGRWQLRAETAAIVGAAVLIEGIAVTTSDG